MNKRSSCSDHLPSELLNFQPVKKHKIAMPNNNKKCNSNQYPLSYPIPTGNSFDLLHGSNSNNNVQNENRIINKNKNKLPKLPPFITKLKSSAIRLIMNKLKIVKYEMKLTSLGLKVTVFDSNHYKQFSDELKKDDAEFFTYTLEENKTSRFVLFGLPSLPIEEVEIYIKEAGLTPSKITKVLPKKTRSNDSALYFVSFPNTVTLNHLKSCRNIGNISCTWDIPHKKPERLTQCSNCFMLGHTTSNCYMKSKCRFCSLNHIDDQECTIKDEVNQFKCANCNGNHAANSMFCPKRTEFLRIREQINLKNTSKSSPSFNYSAINFPNLMNPQNSIQPSLTETPAARLPFSSILKSNTSSINIQQGDQPTVSKLYSSSELLVILASVMDGLRSCQTPGEQVQLILATAIKYVCT